MAHAFQERRTKCEEDVSIHELHTLSSYARGEITVIGFDPVEL